MDLSKPVKNPKLKEAMRRLIEDENPTSQEAMINEILKAKFLAPVLINDELEKKGPSQGLLRENTKINFHLIGTKDETYLMAFTDWEEIRKWDKDYNSSTLVLDFDEYAGIVSTDKDNIDGFVVNPFNENIIFNQDLINIILKGRKENKNEMEDIKKEENKEASILVSELEVLPENLIEQVTNKAKNLDEIEEIYIKDLLRDRKESYLLVVKHRGDRKDLFPEIASATKGQLNGRLLDIVDYDSDFGRQVTEGSNAFYKKDLED